MMTRYGMHAKCGMTNGDFCPLALSLSSFAVVPDSPRTAWAEEAYSTDFVLHTAYSVSRLAE